jgi:exonuclease III
MNVNRPNTFKIAQLNAENLFLFLDDLTPRDWRKMSEKDWQKLSSASTPNKSLVKTLWLADSLRVIDADIVCLNEVGGEESLRNFARFFMQDQYFPQLIEGNSDRGIDVGYLVKKGLDVRTELRTHKDRPLQFLYPHEVESNAHFAQVAPEKLIKSHYFSRDCSELRVFKPNSNIPSLILLLVHLKSKLDPDGIDPEGRGRRQAEMRTLVQIYREIRAEFQQIPVIVTGDFNGTAAKDHLAEEFQDLAETDLESVVDLAALDREASATQLQFNRGGQINGLQIDYIFISPELKPHLIPGGVEVFRYRSDLGLPLPLPKTLEQRIAMPSDHYPVIATFHKFF